MTSFDCDGKVSIWVFRKAEKPEDVEKDVLKEFCGIDYYDSDFQEGMSCVEPAPLAPMLRELSYSESYIDAALAAARKRNIEEVFGVLAQFNFEYDASEVNRPIYDDPQFIGTFDWHD
ncbi:hypothetical protein GC197_14650 [bacterium]|nr:hypothetical protein [bacterium]